MAEKSWLDEVREAAEKNTLERLEKDGVDTHQAKEDAINAAERKFNSDSAAAQNIEATHGHNETDPTTQKAPAKKAPAKK